MYVTWLLRGSDRKRESIIIGPSKINNGGITFTVCPYKPRTRLNFLSVVRVSSQLFVIFFLTVRKAVAAGAEETRSKVARRHALENSYGDVVRHLKG